MLGENHIILEGTVTVGLGNGLCRVRLANGHQVLAHPARKDRDRAAGLRPGETVRLRMSPFDMATGRLLLETTLEPT